MKTQLDDGRRRKLLKAVSGMAELNWMVDLNTPYLSYDTKAFSSVGRFNKEFKAI